MDYELLVCDTGRPGKHGVRASPVFDNTTVLKPEIPVEIVVSPCPGTLPRSPTTNSTVAGAAAAIN